MSSDLQRRLEQLEMHAALAIKPNAAAAARGMAALQRLGIDLGTLTNAELDRLEALVSAWPDDDTLVPAAVVYACLGRG